ncbi:MAG: hypothetical protein CMJ58_16850 [Planctomycetaceae bacterium]|nr:hypothetical protein [Planctomycetaceae bacterium]
MFDIDSHLRPLSTDGLTVVDGPPADAPAKAAKAQLRLVRRVEKRRFVRLQARRSAAAAIGRLPKRGESIHGVMDTSYSAWSLAEAVIELLNEPVRELVIGTLGFNRPNAEALCELLDQKQLKRVLLMVSDYFRSSDRTIFADIRESLESRGQRVAVTRSHAKLLLLRTKNRNVVIETSANLRSSQNWEQFVLSDDRRLLRFHQAWIEQLCQSSD